LRQGLLPGTRLLCVAGLLCTGPGLLQACLPGSGLLPARLPGSGLLCQAGLLREGLRM
jgi:hypothetical protein